MLRKIIYTIRHRLNSSEDSFVDNFHYRPDDVVIVSYPKAGSTWLRFLMANLINGKIQEGPQEVDFLRVQQIVPAISREAFEKGGADYETLPSPRILRSHSLYTDKFPKVIYLIRDGRDILISYYYHFMRKGAFSGTLDEFLLSDCRGVEWDEHADSWIYKNQSLSNICVVRYEDMLSNPFTEVKKMVDFVGFKRTAEQITKAIKSSSYDELRQIEEAKGLGYNPPGDTSIRFIRKGKSQQWKNEFGEKEKAIFKERYGNALIRTGYEKSFLW